MASSSSPESSPVAASYARALLELADDQRQDIEAVGQELRDLRQVVESDRSFGEFLSTPAVGAAERGQALDRALNGRVSPLLMNTLRVLNQHGRLGLLAQLSAAYDDLLKQRLGRVDVDVTVARALSDEELADVRQRVASALGKEPIVRQHVDESIIGGLVLRVGDRLLDASVRSQLRALRARIAAARPKSFAGLISTDGNGQPGSGAQAY